MDEFANKKIKITKSAITVNKKGIHTQNRSKFNPQILKHQDTTNLLLLYIKTSDTIKNKFFKLSKRLYHNCINPLKAHQLVINGAKSFATMDIETIKYKNKQIPVSISLVNETEKNLFIIDNKIPINKAVNKLWKELIKHLNNNSENYKTIFIHNLGNFDGYFIYKYLSQILDPSKIKTIIDHHNRFITISIITKNGNEITFIDSFRIFPVSLNELCGIFDIPGKTNKYNLKYNSYKMFRNSKLLKEFKEYNLQDSVSLFQVLLKAQNYYIYNYNVDITTIVSTSSLSLKIFRAKFLNVEIPILNDIDDKFIRESYFGGATDYYKAYGEDLHYYDINSLYPFAMCKPMPHKIIKHYKNMNDIDIFNFFGFCKVEITTPKTLRPLVPFKFNNKTIFPTGTFVVTLFSEEVKALTSYGYKIKLIEGIEFSKISIFNEYVEHFYGIKKFSSGSEKFLAKMLLNQLYGIFGRKKELIETINIHTKDLPYYLTHRIIKSVITINKDISTLLIIKNIDTKIISKLNSELEYIFKSDFSEIKNNVALASAVTSYARIHMMQFKLNDDIYYSDTDSIITSKKIDSNLIGENLGLMKDELNGHIIKQAYFLDIKKYGYWYEDKITGELIERSVIAGIPRNSISFKEIHAIFQGKIITKEVPIKFIKSFKDLNIEIKSSKVSIKLTNDKELIGNNYIPIHINNKHITTNNSFINFLKNRILKFIKKYIK